MDNILHNLFYNTRKGYTDVNKLYNKTIDLGYKFKYSDISNWYYKQPVNQIYKRPTKFTNSYKIISHYNQIGEMQIDLMIISKYYKYNHGYKYLFNCIDVYSRYAWSYPVKNKKPESLVKYIKEIFKLIPDDNYKSVCCDSGTEFKGIFSDTLNKLNIKIYRIDLNNINSKYATSLIERFNYTLWKKIIKFMYVNNTLSFVDDLPDILFNYNNSIHSTVKQTPYNIFYKNSTPSNLSTTNTLVMNIKNSGIILGDYVRHLKKKKTFDKKAVEPVYSITINRVMDINNGKFVLDTGNEYYPNQLLKVDDDIIYNNKYKDIMKLNKYDMKKERILKADFKKPIEQINDQILNSKRTRKETKRYINNY